MKKIPQFSCIYIPRLSVQRSDSRKLLYLYRKRAIINIKRRNKHKSNNDKSSLSDVPTVSFVSLKSPEMWNAGEVPRTSSNCVIFLSLLVIDGNIEPHIVMLEQARYKGT